MTKYRGLSDDEIKRSFDLYGDNSLGKEKNKGFFKRFLENLSDPIIRILIFALLFQIACSFGNINYLEVCGIVAAILLSAIVSTFSEYRSEKAFEKLNEISNSGVNVLRNGRIAKIPSSKLVVGDIVYLSVGEKIQADGEILSGRLLVDQSALNGEGVECIKAPGKDAGWDLNSGSKLFRGTIITDGSGIMRVGRVGNTTYYGMVAKDVQTETRESPLKIRLSNLASQISKIGYAVAIIVGISYLFNALILDNQFDKTRIVNELLDSRELFKTLLDAITLIITVVVVAAPEGLPMMITVVLSANMKKMLKDNILVKKMVGIETAGSMNILFTDKTGTITEGRPRCEKIVTIDASHTSINSLMKHKRVYELMCMSAEYNTDVICSGGELTGGNATDRAIYEYFGKQKAFSYKVLLKNPFSSEKKFSSVELDCGIELIKGAPELILSSSKYAINKRGDRVPFDKTSIYSEYTSSAANGERVIAIAIMPTKNEAEITFVGLIVMKDKIRSMVRESIKQVLSAGIQVVMITGDGKETAAAIATECGLFQKNAGHIILSADELHKMDDLEIKKMLPRLRVVSRALPQDKTRLVRLSQELGLVVGMTGDGINDAPSLKLADIGFSMGSGTDIAKSASDIVILDNSFLAISKTILYGRTIFKSIRKFITFQLTMNFAACGVSLLGQFLGVDTPITIIQMLWVNIIMDTLGGLAFAGEAPLKYYMQEKPKRLDESILSEEMIHQVFFTGLYTLLLCIFFLASNKTRLLYGGIYPTNKFYTAFYALFIFAGLFNCFLARSSRLWLFSNITKNNPFILIMLLISVIQLCMIYFGGSLFRCTPLRATELSFVILLALTVVPFDMMRRLFFKLK